MKPLPFYPLPLSFVLGSFFILSTFVAPPLRVLRGGRFILFYLQPYVLQNSSMGRGASDTMPPLQCLNMPHSAILTRNTAQLQDFGIRNRTWLTNLPCLESL